jgi:hypothetical protein
MRTMDRATPAVEGMSNPLLTGALGAYAAELGQAVEQAWAARRDHVAVFPEVATRCLREVEVPEGLDAPTILRSVAMARHLVRQEDPRGTFGSPPVTLWRSREFFVSALFWFDGTTSVHQHAFSGAFRVLAGGSIHAPYKFSLGEEVTHRLILGDLQLDQPELLRSGDVRAIEPGNSFIHGLFHLERPSVTLVVRTYGQPRHEPQYNYLRPGVGYDASYRDDQLERRLQSVMALADLDPDAGLEVASEFMETEDLWVGYLLARRWFAKVDRGERFQRLLDALAKRHGQVTAPLLGAFDHERRLLSITTRRQLLTDPEHRLFLALLLNLPDRASMDKVLAQRYPGEDSGDLLARWVTELASPPRRGISGLVMDEAETAAVAAELRAGCTEALSGVKLAGPPAELLRDLFRT